MRMVAKRCITCTCISWAGDPLGPWWRENDERQRGQNNEKEKGRTGQIERRPAAPALETLGLRRQIRDTNSQGACNLAHLGSQRCAPRAVSCARTLPARPSAGLGRPRNLL